MTFPFRHSADSPFTLRAFFFFFRPLVQPYFYRFLPRLDSRLLGLGFMFFPPIAARRSPIIAVVPNLFPKYLSNLCFELTYRHFSTKASFSLKLRTLRHVQPLSSLRIVLSSTPLVFFFTTRPVLIAAPLPSPLL